MKTLYFEGAGLSDADISKATIGNCRIRTAFHLDDGRPVYLEITGAERIKRSLPAIYRWKYTGFVQSCFYITDDIPNDDENKHNIQQINHNWIWKFVFEYTEAAILKFVNSLGASFTAIKVVPDLGGYRVFREKYNNHGSGRYNYGDEFLFDPELLSRRKAVYQHYHELVKAEGQEDTSFSLWTVEDDPGALHLLRRFPGTFQTAHNTHWIIRVDTGGTLEDWIATATESYLGKYGC